MTLLKDGKITDDPWVAVEEGDAIPADGPIVFPLTVWRAQREALIARGGPLGIRLASDEPPSEIAEDISHFALCALEFPKFTDGRAYSYARLLRERHGFGGELRAVGDVLLEQLHFMHRSGFDAFEIPSDHAEQDWVVAQADMDVWYQPTADGRPTAMSLRKD